MKNDKAAVIALVVALFFGAINGAIYFSDLGETMHAWVFFACLVVAMGAIEELKA